MRVCMLLISMYHDYPVLWQVKSKVLASKYKRSAALNDIVCALKKIQTWFYSRIIIETKILVFEQSLIWNLGR